MGGDRDGFGTVWIVASFYRKGAAVERRGWNFLLVGSAVYVEGDYGDNLEWRDTPYASEWIGVLYATYRRKILKIC